MEAIVARLSQLDPHAQGALRLVMFYDTLMRRRVDLPTLVRSSAGLAECVAGLRLHGTARPVRFAPDGTPAADPPAPASISAPVILDEEEIGTVWLERTGALTALDDTLLERFALAVGAVVERYGPARTTMADPALVELAIGTRTDEAARARALRLLGFAAGTPLHVVALATRQPLDDIGARVCPQRPVKAARLDEVGVLLATTLERDRFPVGVRAGVGTAQALDRSWEQARTALRFTTAHRPVVEHAELGALALLARVPRDAVRAESDVAAVARLAENSEDVAMLETYCAAGSLRRTATLLHRHHSSVARRLAQIGDALGFPLTTPPGLVRATLALTAWRLTQE